MQETEETRVQSLNQEDPLQKHGTPLQYSCLENPMDGGDWRATVHGATNSQTGLKQLSMHEKLRSLRKGKRAELCNAQTPPGKLSTSSPELACHRAEWGGDQGMKVRAPKARHQLGKRHDQAQTTNTGSDSPFITRCPPILHILLGPPDRPPSFCLIVPPALVTLNNTSSPQMS